MDEEKLENTTKYGEFVCSFHQWLPIDKQKEQAEKMCRITNRNYNLQHKNRNIDNVM